MQKYVYDTDYGQGMVEAKDLEEATLLAQAEAGSLASIVTGKQIGRAHV